MQHIVSKDETSSTAKSLFNGTYNQLVIFLCVKVLHFLLLHNETKICEVDVTDLKRYFGFNRTTNMWCSWWNFIDEEGKECIIF